MDPHPTLAVCYSASTRAHGTMFCSPEVLVTYGSHISCRWFGLIYLLLPTVSYGTALEIIYLTEQATSLFYLDYSPVSPPLPFLLATSLLLPRYGPVRPTLPTLDLGKVREGKIYRGTAASVPSPPCIVLVVRYSTEQGPAREDARPPYGSHRVVPSACAFAQPICGSR